MDSNETMSNKVVSGKAISDKPASDKPASDKPVSDEAIPDSILPEAIRPNAVNRDNTTSSHAASVVNAPAEVYIDRTLYIGRPENFSERLLKEQRVYTLLDSLGVSYNRLDHDPTETIDNCHEVDQLLGIHICKNLFLCNAQKTSFYLLMMPGEKKFRTAAFSKKMGCSRLSFADAGHMEEFLDITPGSVSVLGLMNDKENHVRLVIDRDILKEEYVGCHPCINTSSLKISREDLLNKILPAIHHDFDTVELDW